MEIGTGDGGVLNYLSSKFPETNKFVGIDLSAAQVDFNKNKFQNNPRLDFVVSHGFDGIQQYGKSNMIFITSRGVLKYFTEQQLQQLFNFLNNLGKTIFIAIEPNDVDHNFQKIQIPKFMGQNAHFRITTQNFLKMQGLSYGIILIKCYQDRNIILHLLRQKIRGLQTF